MKKSLFGTVAAGIMIFGTFAAPLPPAANAQGFTLNEPSQTITFSPLQLQTETSAQQAKTTASSQIDSYYQSAAGKSGPALKKALHDIIDDHTQLSYSQVWDALKKTDEDPKNPSNVLLLYSGISRSKQANGGTGSMCGLNLTAILGRAKDLVQISITFGQQTYKRIAHEEI